MNYLEAREKADRAFATYIVTRDCLASGGTHALCITCRRPTPRKELECGHYHDRDCMALRYDEQNSNAQCIRPGSCNRTKQKSAMLESYYHALERKYGEGTVDRLWKKKIATKCYSPEELIELAAHYRQKTNSLTRQQC